MLVRARRRPAPCRRSRSKSGPKLSRSTSIDGHAVAPATSVAPHGRSTTTTSTGDPVGEDRVEVAAAARRQHPDAHGATLAPARGSPDGPRKLRYRALDPTNDEGAGVDFSKLKTSDWLVGGGAIAYLIAMFLPWYQVKNFSARTERVGLLLLRHPPAAAAHRGDGVRSSLPS